MSQINVWGHRGASGYAPENTIEAFQLAVDMEADGVELDVQLTRDGEPVVIHDETIDRVSNGRGWVKDYTLNELRTLNFNKTHPEYKLTLIPTLEEVYDLLKNTGLYINVELKTGIIFYQEIEEKVLKLAERLNVQDQILYSSFNHYSIMKIKKINPEARIGLLYSDGYVDISEYGKRLGVNAIHPPYTNLKYPRVVEACKENGIQINIWNVRDEDIIDCCKAGVNSIITNYPDRTKKIINNYFLGG